ncbi:MAG TPA: hypothetical protein VIN02_03985 [Sulfurovum sp.]
MMQSKYLLKYLLLFLFLTLNLFAIEGNIRVFIPSQDEIYTSQKTTVAVELLSSAFSITNAKITFPPSDKYIVQEPKSASYLGREEIDGEDWQMVHYDYEIYALKAGKVEIPSIQVSFTASMGYGQPIKEFMLQSDAVSFDVKVPEGVSKDQFVLVTDNFKLTTKIKPEFKKLIVGDAVEISVTQKAYGVPDLLLTPVVYRSNEFLRVYGKEPLLESGLKGTYDVSRTDRFTFVASMEGNVTLSAQEILWYDSKSKTLSVEKIPAMQYEISPDPQIAIDAKKAQQKQLLLYVIAVFVFILGLYIVFASKIRHYTQERKRKYEQSEAGIFEHLVTSVKSDDLIAIDRQYYLWLLSIDPELARGGIRAIETIYPSFAEVLKELDERMVETNREFDRIRFIRELKLFREKILQTKKSVKKGLAATINPS